jgi:NAD(P)-dependent dehydrogenase (short-subunit alcohol dehydrogenase family)
MPIKVNAVHPGDFKSDLMRDAPAPMRLMSSLVSRRSPSRAAKPVVRLLTDAKYMYASGRFFHAGSEIEADVYALSEDAQRQLWDVSAGMTGLPVA